jgi:hypothetical protein
MDYVVPCRSRLFRREILIKEAMITLYCPSRLK